MYHQVTGKTEQIRKSYDNNLLIDASEIDQLHRKIMQLCDVHHVIASNEVISVFHDKERKERFTSFQRFKAYDGNTTSPTINLVLKYNFSIMVAGSKNPQEYTVMIRLASRVALLQGIKKNAPAFMPGRIFHMIAGEVAEIKVDYADYVFARGFIEAFDEWIDGCNCTPESVFFKQAGRVSMFLPKLAGPMMAASALVFAALAISKNPNVSSAPVDALLFVTVFIGGLYLLVTLSTLAAKLIEHAIDSHLELSYVKLNKGDGEVNLRVWEDKKVLLC